MFKFNPLNYGYEPAKLFPELNYQIPIDCEDWFVKVTAYDVDAGCYWYSAIHVNIGTGNDDGVKISSSYHCIKKHYGKYDIEPEFNDCYVGLISTNDFAKQLLSHLFGGLNNESVLKRGVDRLNSDINQQMRVELSKK